MPGEGSQAPFEQRRAPAVAKRRRHFAAQMHDQNVA